MLGIGGEPASSALEERLASDASVRVRVVVAEALANLGDARAVAFLAETVDTHDDVRVRLQALNALTYVPLAAVQPYAAVVERVTHDPDEYVGNAARYLHAMVSGTYDPLAPP
jgi:HEAT repeat protein